MKVFIAIYLCLIAVAIVEVRAQECSLITTYQPDVCLFDPKQKLDFFDQSGSSTICEDANSDPFVSTLGFTNVQNQDACNLLIREDGKDCIQLYAEFLCSDACNRCLQLPCKKFCDTLEATCPITAASSLNCFQFVSPCSDSNTDCTDWNVDKSKLPSAISGSTTKASSTSKATTTKVTTTSPTGTHTTSSGSTLGTFFIFSLVVFVIQTFL